jgi:SAM-dependent methyltransferase
LPLQRFGLEAFEMKNRNIQTDPIFSDPRLAIIYDAFDGERHDLVHYVKIIKDLKAEVVIDLGCGTGCLSLLLAEEGIRAIGVDPAQASIEVAKSKDGADKIEWIVGDACTLQTDGADVVVMVGNVVQAIVAPLHWELTLSHAHAALRTGGHLIFETRIPDAKAWTCWNKESSFQSIEVPGVGRVDGWVDLIDVSLPLVSFRWSYFFHATEDTLQSDSTLQFRTLSDIESDLKKHNFEIVEVRDAPDRPGLEYVVIAQAV